MPRFFAEQNTVSSSSSSSATVGADASTLFDLVRAGAGAGILQQLAALSPTLAPAALPAAPAEAPAAPAAS